MSAYEKPSLPVSEMEEIVKRHLGPGATAFTELAGGNLNAVFSFELGGKGYIMKFSDLAGAYEREHYVSELLSGQGVPFPACLALGKAGELTYMIMERVDGHNLADCTAEQRARQLPELIGSLRKMSEVDVGATKGYGWIQPDGNGSDASWKDFVVAFNAEDQTGTFWENWHELFRASCLEREVYEEIYSRLMDCASYNEGHRSFVHGDFHQWNILSDGARITGIIDGNCMYGDSLVDLATLDRHMPGNGVVQAYLDAAERNEIPIPHHFRERLAGAYYFKGLDGMRFYAKMGREDAYRSTRDFLLALKI